MAVIETIPLNSENVDDYDGDLIETFERAVSLLCDTLNNTSVVDTVKKEIYDWCKGEVTNGAIWNTDITAYKTFTTFAAKYLAMRKRCWPI